MSRRGCGGFTSYPLARIREQVGGWVERGIPQVKMKVSREPERDPERLDAARQASGDETERYVDSNGALSRKQALAWAARIAREWGVTWYEEPVSSADLEGLRFLRAGALAAAFDLDLSAHCAPSASVDACCAVPRFRCLEWLHDHVRLEPLLFDGVLEPENGLLRPDRSRPGNGLELKRADAARYAA